MLDLICINLNLILLYGKNRCFLIENLSKTCLPNGHWEGFENDRQAGYTDFKMCYTARVLGDVNYQVILDGSFTIFVIYSTYFLF